VREIACDILCFPKTKNDLNAFKNSRDLMVHLRERSLFCDVKDIEKGIFEFFSYLFLLSRSIARVLGDVLGVTNSNGMWQVIEIV
jgi:hypothetical protein